MFNDDFGTDGDFGEGRFEARMERDRLNEFGEVEGMLECGHWEHEDCECADEGAVIDGRVERSERRATEPMERS